MPVGILSKFANIILNGVVDKWFFECVSQVQGLPGPKAGSSAGRANMHFSPVAHSCILPVAQLDRASGYGPEDRGSNPRRQTLFIKTSKFRVL